MATKKSESQKPGLEVQIDPDLRYEQAVKELEKLISDMESGKFSLEETLLAYQRGAALLKHCRECWRRLSNRFECSRLN